MRSVCRQNLPILALTATADADYSLLIKESINLSSNVNVVSACPDRPNIRLSVVKIPKKSIDCLDWIITGLKEYGIFSPKTIVYCRSINLVGWLFQELLLKLGKHAYQNPSKKCSDDLLIGMYHSETLLHNKERVMQSLTSNDGIVRVVVATSSLGCGVNATDVQYVIHFGLAYDLADYCQQIGRAGRNLISQCHAILYSYLEGNRKKLNVNIKEYVINNTKSCLRKMLYTPFSENENPVPSLKPGHNCCSFCSVNCDCGFTNCAQTFLFESSKEIEEAVEDVPELNAIRLVGEDEKKLVNDLLLEYHEGCCVSTGSNFTPPTSISGLSPSIISDVIKVLPYITSVTSILEQTPVFEKRVAKEIIDIINDVFGENLKEDVVLSEETYSIQSSSSSYASRFSENFTTDSELEGVVPLQ